jgi:hypothetical protein
VRTSVIIVAAAMLTGCVTAQLHQPTMRTGRSVQLGVPAQAQVGDPMLSEYDYAALDGAVLLDGVHTVQVNQQVRVPGGSRLIASTVQGREAFCATQATVFGPQYGNPVAIGCFFDPDGDGFFNSYVSTGDSWGEMAIPPLRYQRAEEMAGSGYKYDLVYLGISGDTIAISYREFAGTTASPALQQDLTYTLEDDGSTDVSFRGARITVTRADNNSISYVVHTPVRR